MKNRSGEKIKLTSIDELLGVVNEESAMEIEIDKIHPFAGHPFKVIDDEKMQDLIDSIQENGVLTPVLIRPDNHDGYEMISGHRRMHAAQLAGLVTIPAIVREMTDDDAVIAMVDANIQREELLPSEKAFAYKMKLEAMKRQAGRPSKNNSGQNDQNLSGLVSRDVLAQQVGESSKQIQRFIRLTELIPDLLELVDKKRLNFTIAVDISYIPQDVQKWIYEYICDNGFIKPNQIAALRNYLGQGPVTQSLMISILNSHIPVKAPARKVTLNEKKLTKYFPKEKTSQDICSIKSRFLEQHHVEMTCNGVVKVGYTIEDIGIEVDDDSMKIYVSLPELRINSNQLLWDDSLKWNEENNILNPVDFAEYEELIGEIKSEGLVQAEKDGMYEQAEENAQVVITNFLGCFDEYDVVYM